VSVWGRRAITLPSLLLVTVVWLALLPATLVVAAIGDLVRGGRWPIVRCVAYLTVYLACETAGVLAAAVVWLTAGPWTGTPRATFLRKNVALQSWWADALYRAAERIYELRTVVEGDGAVVPGPILLFIRHVSQADTLIPVVYVTRRHGMALRFVLKRELLWDPCLDVVGRRLPNAFVNRGSGESAREIAAVERLLDDLRADEGVLIYPEGTRFTPAKRARALARIAERSPELLARAERLSRVLPPHLGGPLGLLRSNREADVVFCAHTGFEPAGSPREIVKGGLIGSTIRVRFWRVPLAEVPDAEPERIAWLYAQWQRVDDWIAEVHPLSG
jgi:1-acyl-sn-glycerol-3-phosphate acyltransferase